MNLERVTVAIRPRSPWEAVDLGFAMVRTWWRPMLAAWLVTVLPVWILGLGLLYRWPAVSILVLWWLRPLFDRVPLYYASRALFGAPPSLAETVKAWPRPGWPYALAYLTVFRVDIARSFNLPVWQLEGLRGRARGQRLRVLNASSRGTAVALTLACLVLEICLLFGAMALLSLLAPETMEVPWRELFTDWRSQGGSLGAHLLFGGAWFVAFTMIEMAYVAAGFSLYVSRRVQLEGWDIELVFRRLAQRAGQRRREASRRPAVRAAGPSVLGAAVLWFTLLGAAPAAPAVAQDPQAQSESPAAPGDVIQEILSRPEFQTSREVKRWQLKSPAQDEESGGRSFSNPLVEMLARFGAGLAGVFEILLWVVVALAAALLIYYFSQGARTPHSAPGSRPPPPEVLFGLDVREESLPADIAGAALELLAQGKLTEALSLLYRGTLARLVHRQELTIEASWTEADCLAEARPHLTPERFGIFRRLTGDWCRSAYGHRPPDPQALESLCRQWREAFGAGPV